MAQKAPFVYFCNSGGVAYGIVDATALSFGNVVSGGSSAEIPIYIQNDDLYLDLIATEIDCIYHPYGLQSGSAQDTYNAVEFALIIGGTYTNGNPLAFGTCWANYLNGPFYAKWSPPASASKGSKLWGILLTGNYE